MLPKNLAEALRDADALLIVPPFAGIDRPSLGVHIIQSCAFSAGLDVCILYANILLAHEIGETTYISLSYGSTSDLLGERFFAKPAYQVDALASFPGVGNTEAESVIKRNPLLDLEHVQALSLRTCVWIDALVEAICNHTFLAVGCTTTFEQTAASIALLNRVKARKPEILTIIGGANCEERMAQGIRSLSPNIDYVFSGESEATFPPFLKAVSKGIRPDTPIIVGKPCKVMDYIPTPDFTEYYKQLNAFLPDSYLVREKSTWLPYESSRGCWWGQKHHCTFCGLNGTGIVFREKSPDHVLTELRELTQKHPTNLVCMADNIMPNSYFHTLLPRLSQELSHLSIFYEQKANLSLQKLILMKQAGITLIQPGIEAISTPLLRLMDKGVSAIQNIALLRYSRSVGIHLNWNLLWAFPGDLLEWYQETLKLLPLLLHLNPPSGLSHLSIDRFSPYFECPQKYGITNIRPMESYFDVLPADVDIDQVAYHFVGDYESGSRQHPEIIEVLAAKVEQWRAVWSSEECPPPILSVTQLGEDLFLLADTRKLLDTTEFQFLNRSQAMMALVGKSDPSSEAVERWALENYVCAVVDGRIVPLATAEPGLLAHFEALTHDSNLEGRKLGQLEAQSRS